MSEGQATELKYEEHPYIADDAASIYKDLKDGERAILNALSLLKDALDDEGMKQETYRLNKHKLLRDMYAEEAAGTVTKRTEKQREILYRIKLHEQHLAWTQAIKDVEGLKIYVKTLTDIQTSIEARAKLMTLEIQFSGSKYGT